MLNFDSAFSRVGDSAHPHACIIFDDLHSYRNIASKYILEGLNKNEKCVMAVDDYDPAMIAKDFLAAGEDSAPYENAREILSAGRKGSVLVKEIMSLGSRTDL
jgi:hypothetical protein